MQRFQFAGGVTVDVYTTDESEGQAVASRAYWDCATGGVFVPEYAPVGLVYVNGQPIGWKRVS